MEDIKTLLQQQTEEISKQVREDVSSDVKRHISVMTEDFDHKLELIAESVSGVQEQLVAIKEMIAKNTQDMEAMKVHMLAMKSDVEIIKKNLRRKVDVEDFESLEGRVSLLESKDHT